MNHLEETRKANLFRVIYLALCFMMLFTAYFAGQNLMTQIYKQLGYDNLGPLCFSTIFGVFALTSIFSSHYYKKISAKTGIVYGSSVYVLFIFAGTVATYCDKYKPSTSICSASSIYALNIITAGFLGVGAAFLWLCQSTYVNACALEETRGMFNGVFFSIFQISQILSGVIATVVLGTMDQFSFYVVLVIFGGIAVTMFTLMKEPVPYGEVAKVEEREETINEALVEFGRTIRENKYRFLYMAIIFTGVGTSFYASTLGTIVGTTADSVDPQVINKMTGYVFIVLALGAISAGITIGKLADKYDKVKVLIGTMIAVEIALFLTFMTSLQKSFPLATISGAFWGYVDSALNTLIVVIIGSRFNSSPQVFSAYRFLANVGATFTTICATFVPKDNPIMLIVIIAAALVTFQSLFFSQLAREGEKSNYVKLEEQKLMVELKNI